MANVMPVSEHISMLLSCYLDGTLSPAELNAVVVALESDEQAIAEFRRMKEARSTVRLLPLLELPGNLAPPGHLSEQLSAFLDGELATLEIPVLTSHLAACTECRYELAELDRSRTAVRALPGLEPPAFLALHSEDRKPHRHRRFTALAVASGAVAVTLAFTIGPFAGGPEPVSVSISDLEVRHTAVDSMPSSGTAIQGTHSP